MAGPTAPLIELFGKSHGLTFVPVPVAERRREESLNTPSRETIEDTGLTGIVQWKAGKATLKSITGLRDWRHSQIDADADFSPADLFVLDEPATIASFSQELDASFEIGRTNLLLGAYYEREDYRSVRSAATGADADNYLNALISAGAGSTACLPPIVALDCAFPTNVGALLPDGEFTKERYTQQSTSTAAFAHASISLPHGLALVAGLRYSQENKHGGVVNSYWYDSPVARAALAAVGVPDDGTPRNGLDLIGTLYSPSFTAAVDDDETAGVLSLQYFAARDLMVYGSYHHGYKAGGVNLFREGAITETTYRPETADSYELGLKAEYARGRARMDAALFDTKFSDLQIDFFTGLEFKTENVGQARTRGIEVQNAFLLTTRIRLDLSATYLEAAFGNLETPDLYYLDNRDTPMAPRFSAVGTLDYEWPLPRGLAVFARALLNYAGPHYVGAEVPMEEKVGSYLIGDLSIGLRDAGRRWEATLWCTNCGDRTYRTIYFNTTFQPGSYSVYLNAPREYGVTLRMRF